MRSVSISVLIAVTFLLGQSCNSNGLPIEKEDLTGKWMVIRTTTSDDYTYERIVGQVNDMRKKAEMTIFQFQPNGNGLADLGQTEYNNFNWSFNPNQQLSMQIQEQGKQMNSAGVRPRIFTVKYFKHDSLIIENVVKNNYDSVVVKTVFLQLKSNDTLPDLFQPELNKWREKALQPESEEAIRTRIKRVLNYYSAYFASLEFNKITHFNTTKILCPVKIYSNGIGMKDFKANDNWTKVFYDSLDAKKAHDLLHQAVSNAKYYPSKGDEPVRIIVKALKRVADKL